MITKMRKALFILFVSFSLTSFAQPTDTVSNRFLEYIHAADYDAAVSLFSDSLKAELPADKLKISFERQIRVHGDIIVRDRVIKTFYIPYDIVYRFLWFGDKGFRLYFKMKDTQIVGLMLIPQNQTNQYDDPEYANKENFRLQHVLIQSGNYGLTGEFFRPVETDTFPVVVFIHGSGPNDRDEGMYGNRPFRDMAYGLANYGIGSLRFDKSSYLFGEFVIEEKTYTVWDEIGVDVTNIISYLNKIQGIENERIILFGHSLGANQMPRMLDSLDVAAAIMAAGNARPLQDLLYEQFKFLYKLDGDLSDVDKRRLSQLKAQIDNLEKLRKIDPADADFTLPLGISSYYWKDMILYNPIETIKIVEEPIFLIQGEGDYQVSMKDFRMFRRALRKRKLPYEVKSYEKVNHLLFENVGEPSNKEYERPDHVEDYIIKDVAEWIKKLFDIC
ncbi:MAG: prolyl oligopeptidase family serine peptidase [Bacteroidota bacterium]|nr:prolyl oligopeptidase family serine peptidase [Bacteroidota bacterium]